MTTRKTITLTRQTFVTKQCFCFLIHCLGFSQLFFQGANVFQFHGCSHHLQWFWSAKKIKPITVSIVPLSICHEVMGPDARILVFWMLSFKPTFSLSSFTFIKRLFSSSSLFGIRVVSAAYLRLLIFLLAISIGWIVFRCMCVPHILYSSVYQWTYRLLPYNGYWK